MGQSLATNSGTPKLQASLRKQIWSREKRVRVWKGRRHELIGSFLFIFQQIKKTLQACNCSLNLHAEIKLLSEQSCPFTSFSSFQPTAMD